MKPQVKGVVDDERAAVDKPVQGLEKAGEGLASSDLFGSQAMKVARTGVYVRVDNSMEFLADFALRVEG